ncbi:MAG: biotin/lipoyl-binding protein, partial [Cellulosilyticaceae bacterium]
MKDLESFKERRFALKLLGGFLIIMIVLTVLSRVADSITVPFVKVSTPKSIRINHDIEVEGKLEPKDELGIASVSGFMIKKVHAQKGDRVSEGDLLITLDVEALEDKLLQAEIELKKLEVQKKQLELDNKLPSDEDFIAQAELAIKRIKEDREMAMGDEVQKVQRAEEDLSLAEQDLKDAQEKLEIMKSKDLEKQLQKAEEDVLEAKKNLEDKKYERDKALKSAQLAIDDAYANYNNVTTGPVYIAQQAIERAKLQYKIVEEDWKRVIKDSEEALKKAEDTLAKVKKGEIDQEQIKAQEQNVQTAKRNVDAKQRVIDDMMQGQSAEVIKINRLLEDAQIQLEKARRKETDAKLTEENQEIKTELQKSLIALDEQIKLKEVHKLQQMKANGGLITADQDGMITEVKAVEGNQTTGGTLMTLVSDETTYEFVGEITE